MADLTPPTFASAATNSTGTQVVVTLTETESLPILPSSGITGFSVKVGGGAERISGSGTRLSNTTLGFTISPAIAYGETAVLNAGGTNVTDSSGNHLPTITNAPITNNVPEPAAIVLLIQAMATDLDAHTFRLPFNASYSFRPVQKPEELASTTCTVVPRTLEEDSMTRSDSLDETLQIDVAIQQKLAGTAMEVENLLGLVEEIRNYLCGKGWTIGTRTADWEKTANVPIYAVEHLNIGVFTSVLTITYKVLS